jgi:Cu-Zn family superoxide dismutase
LDLARLEGDHPAGPRTLGAYVPIETLAAAVQTFELPGEAVFPESIGVDPSTGDAYVGSLADGTLFRLPADGGEAELWSGAGEGGRCSVAGVKVDARGRLWAAGGYEGTLWVYELADRRLLSRVEVGAQPSCVNDIAFGPEGEAYLTDSFIPTLFRADGESLALERWVGLVEQGLSWPEGLNLNGIVLTGDGRHLVSCQTNTGRFWRVELESRVVEEVALDGGPLEHSDGLALSGSTLYAAVNAHNRLAVVELSEDGASGQVRSMIRSEAFAFPTAIAVRNDRLLVLNAQLDKMGSTPLLPFTVIAIEA